VRSCFSGPTLNAGIDIRVTPHWVHGQSASHRRLLDSSRRPPTRARFDAIVVPTNRPVDSLTACMGLALETCIPLIVICSKLVQYGEVIDMATDAGVKAYALDLPANPPGPVFETSSDGELAAASSVTTRDLSTKRNVGLMLARVLGWQRLMFLDDDIFDVSREDVDALAAVLSDHSVSVLIPEEFPDNSVACHANRLGGGEQGKFASAGGMGVRCDRSDLAFFPNIYNGDWFFFFGEAGRHTIIQVGESKQRRYDPYADRERAIKEEFGDLLAEGLYARLDHEQGLNGIDPGYWAAFIDKRREFHERVAESLTRHPERHLDTDKAREIRAAEVSIEAAREQLGLISPELCDKYIKIWQTDLAEWRRYLTKLDRLDSIGSAFEHLDLDYAESPFPSSR
jgi:hypothetical protein